MIERGPRGQSDVVGVALLVGLTVLAMAGVTATVGTVVQGNAAAADAGRVAAGFDEGLQAVETTGPSRGRVAFSGGELRVVDRELRVLEGGSVVRTVPVDALVYRHGSQRTVYLAGAVLRDTGTSTSMYAEPPITASRSGGSDGVLVVGAPALDADRTTVAGTGATSVGLETDVRHDRSDLGNGTYAVAVETTTPGPWSRYFRERGATVSERDFDGDGRVSVVAQFPGDRVAYLVVHDLNLEVTVRG